MVNRPARRAGAIALAALCAALVLAGSGGARAQGAHSPWERNTETAVRLIAAAAGVGEAQMLRVGLQFELEPGWKTYWRSPGDAGFPVSVDWAGSGNLAEATMAWPAPHRFSLFGLETFGYAGEVVFPVTVQPQQPGQPVALKAHVNYLVCEEICIPYEADLALDLPAGPATPTEHTQLIDRFDAQVPGNGAAHGLSLERVGVAADAGGPVLEVVARSRFPFDKPDLIVEGPRGLYFGVPAVALGEDGHRATLSVPVDRDEDGPALETASLTVTLVDGTRGLERALVAGEGVGEGVGGADAAAPPVAPTLSIWPMLLVALLGGLILNLMPCVLPVLSLKLIGVVGFGGAAQGVVRRSFLASAAGVVATFLALAGALAGLKTAGVAVGWGIQFQQPVFLVVMAFVVTLFACNLWGWFEVPLPRWLGAAAALGSGRPERHESMGGAFLTGVLATLLATPCSAPFLGTAVGFALARGTGEIMAIFAVLGVGLALPYLLVAALPRLATWLPRPGRWMLWLKRVLALALAGTAVWLLWVLAAQLPPAGVAVVAALLVAVAALLAVRPRLPREARLATPAVVVLLAAVAVFAPGRFETPAPRTASIDGEGYGAALRWQAWDPAAIPALVAEGKLVFVDVTADWCITCQVNKRFVLDGDIVAARLGADGVVAMRADWTRPDDAIAQYLASFGRYGIPFNAVYGPGAPDGIALPELLTDAAVLDALDSATAVRAAGG